MQAEELRLAVLDLIFEVSAKYVSPLEQYTRVGAMLLLPSQEITPRPIEGKHLYYAGRSYSIALRTSRPKKLLAPLSTCAEASVMFG